MPATTTTTSARRSRSSRPSTRCRPATPTSTTSSAGGRGSGRQDASRATADRRCRQQDDDQATRRRRRLGRPGEEPRLLVVPGVGQLCEHRVGVLRVRPGEQRGPRTLPHRGGDQPHLCGRLRLAVHRFGVAAALRSGRSRGRPSLRKACRGSARAGVRVGWWTVSHGAGPRGRVKLRTGCRPGRGDEPEAGPTTAVASGAHRPPADRKVGRRQLDPGDVAVVPDPGVGEAEGPRAASADSIWAASPE